MCSLALQIPLLKTHFKIQLLIYQNTARRNCRSEKSFGLFCEVHRHVQKDHINVKIIIKIKSVIGILTPKKQKICRDSNPRPQFLLENLKKIQGKTVHVLKSRPKSCVVGPTVECSLANPEVLGSNPGGIFVFQTLLVI